jgi:hypothetical protein
VVDFRSGTLAFRGRALSLAVVIACFTGVNAYFTGVNAYFTGVIACFTGVNAYFLVASS